MTTRAPVATAQDRYTVAGLIRHLARSRPDHEMLVCGDERRTWSEEYRQACRVANACLRDGLVAGDRIAFLDRNGMAYFDLLFGGSLIGAVNVAVNWRLSPEEMAAIIDDSTAPLLVVHADYVPALRETGSPLPGVRRIVVLGDATSTDRRACRVLRGMALRERHDGSGPCRNAGRGEHAAVHLRHHRAAQGGHADEREPRHGDRRGGADLRHRGRHREPGGHAAVPHRRFGVGAVRHVSGWTLRHPA